MISLTHEDGTVFKGENMESVVNKYNAYEANQKLKKQKEQEEHAKAVAAQKAKDEVREKAMKRVNECIDLVNEAVKRYEEETGKKLEYVTVNGKLTTQSVGYIGKYVGLPIINISTAGTHDNWWDQLYKSLKEL